MIRNILFDLGNVLIDIHLPATEDALRNIQGMNMQALDTLINQHKWFDRYECGEMSEESFVNAIQRCCIPVPQRNIIVKALNALLKGIPASRFAELEKLRRTYNLYVLSNTNETHLNWIHRYLIREYNIAQFESTYFDKVYYSHLVGMRKPDMAIFTHIMSNTGIDPAETLFVDDNFDNITAGKLAGLHVHHHNPEFEIFDILPDILKVANT